LTEKGLLTPWFFAAIFSNYCVVLHDYLLSPQEDNMLRETVLQKIDQYNPKGSLAHTARLILGLYYINHESTGQHVSRVALRAEAVALATKKDAKAAFFGGLLHDIAKVILPANLFDGHNISAEEYAQVKTHAKAGFDVLKDHHMFTALCAGLHHNLYKEGYGVTVKDLPNTWSPSTIKKVLEISTIISICDFIDAFTHRTTSIKDGSNASVTDLQSMLYQKYPNDQLLVDTAIAYQE
jgi:hypothetical protein